VNTSEEGSETQGGEAPTELKAEAEVRRPVTNVVPRRDEDEKEVAAESDESGIQSSTEVISQAQSVGPLAKIDEAKVTFSGGDGEGFRLDFKLVNLIGEPITGSVAIIASLSPPHNPRFVSFPSMKLVDGMPVKLRKSVRFDIRYYKYVTGKFYFPFSYAESFRILVYNRDEELISDSTLPAGEVAVHQPLSEAQTSPSDSI
jgi:hypothetical protein